MKHKAKLKGKEVLLSIKVRGGRSQQVHVDRRKKDRKRSCRNFRLEKE